MERTDEQLIGAYLAGDIHAFSLLTERYLKQIYNFIYRFTGLREEIEDITQEVFVKVWKHLSLYKTGQSVKTWIFHIARNTAIDYLRKKRHVPLSYFEDETGENILLATTVTDDPLPDMMAIQTQDRQQFEIILSKLSVAYREVLLLHYYEDMTLQEIADMLGVSVNTIKSRHLRAIALLRTKVDLIRYKK